MEVRTDDARYARSRCLEAMAQCKDVRTRRSLWRAALRFNERVKGGAGLAGEDASPPLAHGWGGSGHVRELGNL